MKRKIVLSALLLGILLILIVPQANATNIIASGICGDNIVWQLDSDGILTMLGNGPMYDYGDIDGDYYPPWILHNMYISTVIIDKGITHIGNRAFFNCDGIHTVNMPDSLISIGDYAFSWCTKLKEIRFPSSISIIGSRSFLGCTGLKQLYFMKDLPIIGYKAFYRVTAVAYYPIRNDTWLGIPNEKLGGSLVRIPYMPVVEVYKVISHSSGNILYWNAVNGAEVYQVYRKYEGETFWSLVKITRRSAYKDNTARTDVKSYYKIVAKNAAYKSDIDSTAATSVTRIGETLPNVSVIFTVGHSTGNILYWEPVENAVQYQVYRLENGKWFLIETTSFLGYKDETAEPGLNYCYKVVAKNGDIKSDITTTAFVSITRPE